MARITKGHSIDLIYAPHSNISNLLKRNAILYIEHLEELIATGTLREVKWIGAKTAALIIESANSNSLYKGIHEQRQAERPSQKLKVPSGHSIDLIYAPYSRSSNLLKRNSIFTIEQLEKCISSKTLYQIRGLGAKNLQLIIDPLENNSLYQEIHRQNQMRSQQ